MKIVSDWVLGILSLSRWEWFKLRRRWMPWALLAILILFPQIGLVSSYFIYRGDLSGNALEFEAEYGFERTDSEGRTTMVTFTCAEIRDGAMPASVANLPPEEQESLAPLIEDYRSVCEDDDREDVLTSDSRDFFVMPASLTNGLSAASFIGIVVAMVLATSLIGTEYAWGTLRTNLVSSVARRKFLASKIATLMGVAAGGLLVTTVMMALTSLLFTVLVRHVGGGWADTGDWSTVFIMFGKVLYALVPYLMLAVFFAVLTSSTGVGIALAMGYYMVEAIAVGIMSGLFAWFETLANFILGPNVSAWLAHDDVVQVTFGIRADGDLGAFHFFLVIAAYTVALGAAAFWRFESRDVAGAKGD